MAEDKLTEKQIALLFEVGEKNEISYTVDRKRDFDRLLQTGYVEPGPGLPNTSPGPRASG